ncbi:MAG: hypothetical protein JOZ86_12805 [Candidatus Eremiobacteraeota bacterium]|nr:hypothetical protein [Candidatus Eremiobacteraeota bacterium]
MAPRPSRLLAPAVLVAVIALVVLVLGGSQTPHGSLAAAATPAPAITVGPIAPTELPTAAPSASLAQAATFAWQEFFALNWPAVAQTGNQGQRDTYSPSCAFGDPKCTGPLVWETFRGKVEIFPGQPNPPAPAATPPGYPGVPPATPTPGSSPDPSFGYDALPQYDYQNGPIPPCGTPAPTTAWINLDETDQITLDAMYAGAAPQTAPGNSQPQLIRFLAKANRTEYTYVAANQWWGLPNQNATPSPGVTPPPYSAPVGATAAYVAANSADPPAGSTTLVSFPNGTMEVKAAWRLLGPGDDPSRFHTALARYYEQNGSGNPCYQQATFGLVALHIIQKTPSAPYFIYATFEQADNLLTSSGQHVEDDDGGLSPGVTPQPCAAGQATPCPTTPTEQFTDSAKGFPFPSVALTPASAPFCTASVAQRPAYELYFQETALPTPPPPGAPPSGGYICVNSRDNPIPPEIIAINAAAHNGLSAYDAAHGITTSPWQHYKLINVQYEPIDKNYAGIYKGNDPTTGMNPASYMLANGVVETNIVLQEFSGGLVLLNNTRSDYNAHFGISSPVIHQNTFVAGSGYNMGGCMGCHGSQGQHPGGDFSVIMARGAVQAPETPPTAAPQGAMQVIHNRSLVHY